ncbi:hypothetical protein E5288_WYG017048 [Bos mutus]|uniref:Uncharacterized protein n=1 Tax=Bos mutus TaxID=72004 RepID=A0A6B0RJE8_9CETA|nr:hypothetical protein [Bos mutus]
MNKGPDILPVMVSASGVACLPDPAEAVPRSLGPRKGLNVLLRTERIGCTWTQLLTRQDVQTEELNDRPGGFKEEKEKFIVLTLFSLQYQKFILSSFPAQRALQTLSAPVLAPKQGAAPEPMVHFIEHDYSKT